MVGKPKTWIDLKNNKIIYKLCNYLIFTCMILFKTYYLYVLQIFKLLIQLRANSRYKLGVQEINEYSPYIYVDRCFGVPPSPNLSTEDIKLKEDVLVQIHYISLAPACKILITALQEELGKT